MSNSPTNQDRADWAQVALDSFTGPTFPSPLKEGSDDEADAISDLICALLHLARLRDHDPDLVLAASSSKFEHERTFDWDEQTDQRTAK